MTQDISITLWTLGAIGLIIALLFMHSFYLYKKHRHSDKEKMNWYKKTYIDFSWALWLVMFIFVILALVFVAQGN